VKFGWLGDNRQCNGFASKDGSAALRVSNLSSDVPGVSPGVKATKKSLTVASPHRRKFPPAPNVKFPFFNNWKGLDSAHLFVEDMVKVMFPVVVQSNDGPGRKLTNARTSRLGVTLRLLLGVMKKVGISAPVTLSVAIELLM
jgi:hypothetical protein